MVHLVPKIDMDHELKQRRQFFHDDYRFADMRRWRFCTSSFWRCSELKKIFIDLQTSFKDNGLNQRTIKTTSMQIILNLNPFFTLDWNNCFLSLVELVAWLIFFAMSEVHEKMKKDIHLFRFANLLELMMMGRLPSRVLLFLTGCDLRLWDFVRLPSYGCTRK